MKLSVLGAAGATGIPLVEQALAAGHTVTALVRSGQKLSIANPNLHPTSMLSKATQPTPPRSPRR
jgi:putative NADH-flavin reductase